MRTPTNFRSFYQWTKLHRESTHASTKPTLTGFMCLSIRFSSGFDGSRFGRSDGQSPDENPSSPDSEQNHHVTQPLAAPQPRKKSFWATLHEYYFRRSRWIVDIERDVCLADSETFAPAANIDLPLATPSALRCCKQPRFRFPASDRVRPRVPKS